MDRGEGDARARVFFYKCQFISGELDYKAEDYLWLTSEELLSHLDPQLGQVCVCVCEYVSVCVCLCV